MILKFKSLRPNAKLPSYAYKGDAGLDLFASEVEFNTSKILCIVHTGVAVEIPTGYVGLLFARSSIYKTCLTLRNSVGVIDSGYRGEIILNFHYTQRSSLPVYQVGEKCGQLLIIPIDTFKCEFVNELEASDRDNRGFGSSSEEEV